MPWAKFRGFCVVWELEGDAGDLSANLPFTPAPMAEVTSFLHVPSFGGVAPSFANYEETAVLRNQIPALGPRKRAANLLLRMTDSARRKRAWPEACMAIGEDNFRGSDAVQQILRIPRGRFSPDAIYAGRRDAAKFTNSSGADRSTDTFLMELDVLRGRAEARMAMGSGPPGEFAAIL